MMSCSGFRSKSRGSKAPASTGRDKKGEKDLEKDKGRTLSDGRRTATIAGDSILNCLSINLYLRQRGYVFAGFCLFVCLFVCLSVCLCVSKITQKVVDGSF